jgi:dephospho-CoA kinase
MLRVAVTGGIGSGKSTVAGRLAQLGAVVADSDRLAREVVAAGTPGLAAIASRFGSEVLTAAGDLDRAALAAIVFADPAARIDLERIIHPAVRARFAEIADAAPIAPADRPRIVRERRPGPDRGADRRPGPASARRRLAGQRQ